MPTPERPYRRPRRNRDSGLRLHPTPLPPDLAESLKHHEFACLTYPTDQGTALIAKAPAAEIESIRGTVPIELRHELYRHATAPVIRMVTLIHDQPDSALALESFINVEDEQQR